MWTLRALLAILSMSVIAFGALAQISTVPVRAGEHVAFTRLVIQIPEENDWRLTQQGHLARLHISGPALGFDLSQTFAAIPRTRLASLRQTDTGLELRLACDCVIRASEDLPQSLVMDITQIDAPDARPARNTARPKARPERPQPQQAEVPPAPSGPAMAAGQSLAITLTGRPVAAQQRNSLLLSQVLGAPLADSASPVPSSAQPPALVEGMTRAIGRALSEAVGQGLLSPDQDIQPAPQPQIPMAENRPQPGATAQGSDFTGHLSITDSIPTARGDRPRALQNDIFSTCPPPANIDPSTWGASASPLLAPSAPELMFSELDTLDVDATRGHVRHHLFLGSGQRRA